MLLTSHDRLGNTGRKTGFWLEEFAAPYFVFRDAGAELTLALPQFVTTIDDLDIHFIHVRSKHAREMANRPQTLDGIEDSPAGLAAWMLDHDAASRALIARVFDGQSEGLTGDDTLDNITLYWLTKTAVSSARLYSESKLPFFAPKGVPVPTAVSDYQTNVASYPKWQAWMPETQPRLLVIWGKHDLSFQLTEPEAYRRDVPDAEIHVLDAGHFALDTAADEIAVLVQRFAGDASLALVGRAG